MVEFIDKIIVAINNTCKFRIIGWSKRGEVTDISIEQPRGGYNAAESVQVKSGTFNHHVTRIYYMKPESIGNNILEMMQFNILTGFVY